MSEKRSVDTTVQPSFNVADSGLSINLEFSADNTLRDSSLGWIALRQFPNVTGVTAVASVGKVEYTGQKGQLERNEFVTVQDSDSFSANYPIDGGDINTDVIFAYDNEGNLLNPANFSFSASNNSSEIASNIPFTGAIRVKYTSTYRIYRYKPEGSSIFDGSGSYLGRNYGTILMFKGPVSAVLETQGKGLTDPADQPNKDKELYRVVSTVTTNESGTWEKHPNFDSGGFWPDSGAPQKDDGLAKMDWERVHEIGRIVSGSVGRVTYETYDAPLEQGDGAGPPTMSLRKAADSSFINTIWMDSYNKTDKDKAFDEAEGRFPSSPFT